MANSISKFQEIILKTGMSFDDLDTKKLETVAKTAGDLMSKGLVKEAGVAFDEIGKMFNKKLIEMGKGEIDFADMIKMPDDTTLEKMTSGFTAAIASNVAGGIVGGIKDGIDDAGKVVSDALKKQLGDLEAQRKKLEKERAQIELSVKNRAEMNRLSRFEIREAQPLQIDGDLIKEANKLLDEFQSLALKIDKTNRPDSYVTDVIKAQEKLNDLYRAQLTLKKHTSELPRQLKEDFGLVADKNGEWDNSFEYSEFTESVQDAFMELDDTFEEAEDSLHAINKELQKIDVKINNIRQEIDGGASNVVQNGLKEVEEIEKAYDRILKKKNKQDDISKAVNYVPNSESLTVLKNSYNKSVANEEGWEEQYKWLIKFVKEYETYETRANSETGDKRKNMLKTLKGYTKLYNQIKPLAASAETSLQNVLNMVNKVPLVGIGGENKSIPITVNPKVEDPINTIKEVTGGKEEIVVPVKPTVEGNSTGSILNNPMFANMFKKPLKDDSVKYTSNALDKQSDILTNISKLTDYVDTKYLSIGRHLSDFLDDLQKDSSSLNAELKGILTTLGLIDGKGNLNFDIKRNGEAGGGTTHNGALISDEFVLIERGDYNRVKDSRLPESTQNARKKGANVAEVLGYLPSKHTNAFFDVQRKATGYNLFKDGMIDPDVVNATEEQLQQLVQAFITARNNGFDIENGGSNIVYDKDKGFSFYDLEEWDKKSKEQWDGLPEAEKLSRALEDALSIFNGLNRDNTAFDGDPNKDKFIANFRLAVEHDLKFNTVDYKEIFDSVFDPSIREDLIGDDADDVMGKMLGITNGDYGESGDGTETIRKETGALEEQAEAERKVTEEKEKQTRLDAETKSKAEEEFDRLNKQLEIAQNAQLQAEKEAQQIQKNLELEKQIREEKERQAQLDAEAKAKVEEELKLANEKFEAEKLARAEAEKQLRVANAAIEKQKNTPDQVETPQGVAINEEQLRSVLSAITYNVKVVADNDSTADSKVAIDEQSLRAVLDSVVYKVKSTDNIEKQSNDNDLKRDFILKELAKYGTAQGAKDAGKNTIQYNGQEVNLGKLISDYFKTAIGKSFDKNAFESLWKEARDKYYKFVPKEMSKEDAVSTLRNKFPDNVLDGWFRGGDSSYKGQIEKLSLSDDDIRNAALNIMWDNYKQTSGKKIGFDEFLSSDIPMYRGKNSEKYVDGDQLLSLSFDRSVAEKFGQYVLETIIKPIDTLGSYQTTGETEALVYRNSIEDRPEYKQWQDSMAGKVADNQKPIESTQAPWALEETLKGQTNAKLDAIKGVLDNIQAQEKIQPVSDVGNVLATENTLVAIKAAVESINSKTVQGTKISQESKVKIPTSVIPYENAGLDLKTEERAKTALTSLLKYKTTLQEAGQLTGDLEAGINSLYDELRQISSSGDLATWNEHFKQFKNASDILKTLAKDYEVLGKVSARAINETDPTKQAQLLSEVQRIKDRIDTKSVDVNVDDGRFDTIYQTAYENTEREIKQKAELAEAIRLENEARREEEKVANDAVKAQEKLNKESQQEEARRHRRDAMAGKAKTTVGRAENTFLGALSMDDYEKLPESFKSELIEYQKIFRALGDEQDKVAHSKVFDEKQQTELAKHTVEVNKLTNEYSELIAEYQKLRGDNVNDLPGVAPGTNASISQYEQALRQAVMTQTNGRAQIKGFNNDTKTLTYTLKTGKNEFTTYTAAVRHLDKQMVSVAGSTKRVETFFEASQRKLKEISSYVSAMSVFSRAWQELRRGIQYVKEIDLALVELRKVTDKTEEEYDQFLQTASKTAARLSSTISAVTEATSTFAKLGYEMKQAAEMAEAAIVYKNVGDGIESTEDAANSIISTMKGFRLEASESMRIVDRFNEVGNRFAITSQGLGEALRLSASALNEGGNTLDESIGLITAAM